MVSEKQEMNNAENLIELYDHLFSVTNPESDVSKINRAEGRAVTVSEVTYDLVQKSLEMSEQTEGLFEYYRSGGWKQYHWNLVCGE